MIGAAGLVAFASPASATDGDDANRYGKQTGLVGEAVCDLESETWTVTWTVSNPSPWVQATVIALSSDVDGIAINEVVPTNDSVSGTQTFPSGTESAELTAELKWAWQMRGTWKSVTSAATATVELGTCTEEEPPGEEPPGEEPPGEGGELGGFVNAEFDCETVFITIQNDSEADVTFAVVPSEGDAVEVTVGAGETSEEITFPVSVGLIIDLQVEGESVLEDGPFEFTEEDLEGCDEGEGGELPQTGASTGLIALGAVALLALGGGLFLVARRRRVTFTA